MPKKPMGRKIAPNPRSKRLGLAGHFERHGTVPIGWARKRTPEELERPDRGKGKKVP